MMPWRKIIKIALILWPNSLLRNENNYARTITKTIMWILLWKSDKKCCKANLKKKDDRQENNVIKIKKLDRQGKS